MKIFSSLFDSVKSAPGKFKNMIFGRASSFRSFLQPRSKVDFEIAVGDGTGSSIVMAPLMWIARTFPEAPVGIWETNQDGQEEQVLLHDLLQLMRRPNPYYSGPALWQSTLIDYFVDGNAYWLKVRDVSGAVRELWWAPHWTMTPVGNEKTFITHYEYKPGSEKIPISPDDVVHFRFGLDSDNPRQGRAPLKSVLREVYTDDEAANFTASLLRNMGVPGLLVSPELGGPSPSPEDVKATKAYVKESFTGDLRGGALVMSGPTKVQQFGFNPKELLLKELRRIPEERTTAVLGVPAIVAGLGAGLDRSTFSNFSEAREAGYEQTIIPTQVTMGEDIWFQLLPDFVSNPDDRWLMRVGFDLSKVRVLQEDQDKLGRRMSGGMTGGWAMRSDARRAMGMKVAADGSDDVYLVPSNTAIVPADGSPPKILTAKQ